MFDLTGKTAIITGSSKGIGKSIAMQMALHGAQVVVSSRKADACQVVADEINEACGIQWLLDYKFLFQVLGKHAVIMTHFKKKLLKICFEIFIKS